MLICLSAMNAESCMLKTNVHAKTRGLKKPLRPHPLTPLPWHPSPFHSQRRIGYLYSKECPSKCLRFLELLDPSDFYPHLNKGFIDIEVKNKKDAL